MILVFVPYHAKKRHCIDHILDWVEHAELPDCEVILRWHTGPWGETDAVKKHREFARLLAVERQATHLFLMDADTLPPLDVIPRLLAQNVPVVGGIYHSRGSDNTNTPKIVAWRSEDEAQNFQHEPSPVEVDGMGMGCVLLNREAFTSFSFLDWKIPDDDYPAYDRLKQNGFKILLDTSIVCRHYETKDKYY